MTQVLGERGITEPVTVVQLGPCVVLQVKTKETDGYDALRLGFGDVKPHRSTKALIGVAARAGVGPKRVIREVRLAEPATNALGDVLTVEEFSKASVDYVDVAGVTKGKGFMGVMRRYGMGGQPASHGTERKHRSPGSIGGMAPRGHGRSVKKGKRMAGHTGNVRRSATGLKLMKIDAENDLLLVRGSVPGPNGGVVMVRRSKKRG
jgi:large subunit ribosomal protein L3